MNALSLRLLAATTLALATLTACGGGGDGRTAGTPGTKDNAKAADDACAITSKDTIQKVTGGTVADGVAGGARNCEYAVTGGSVDKIDLYAFGSADNFDGIKSGYESNRGGTEELSGIGSAAFSPKDIGQNEVVVRAGDIVFAVALAELSADTVHPEVKALATAVASELD